MYEWLKQEMAEIRWRRFFLVDGPASEEFRQRVEQLDPLLPPSYKEFIFEFGGAKLYRELGAHKVAVYPGPKECTLTETAEKALWIGSSASGWAYFKTADFNRNAEVPVFEGKTRRVVRVADSFEQWLKSRCHRARMSYTKNEWNQYVNGPAPFTDREKSVVDARRKFRWKVVGISEKGDLRFEVHNGSDMVLPRLSVGIRRSDNAFEGGIKLDVSKIKPGETGLVEEDCYKFQVPPEKVVVVDEPDPEPEDRDRYPEFGKLKD